MTSSKKRTMSNKRNSIGSATTQTLLDFDLEESSSDSDFRIEDHDDVGSDCSDDDDDDEDDNDGDDDDDDDDNDNDKNHKNGNEDSDNNSIGNSDSDEDYNNGTSNNLKNSKLQNLINKKPNTIKHNKKGSSNGNINFLNEKNISSLSITQLIDYITKNNISIATITNTENHLKLFKTPICCACLGDRSDDTNEIVECDNCGITVHEGCYGISDSGSISSTVSSCSTEPWFCESCKANAIDPTCELCPNKGGIFKETDVGKWVHLVCALYVPGVAFGEVDQLTSVTLFEMPYSKWGAKTCSLCDDVRFARSGVCIGCDAGMCKTYFHVTCAQAAGLLSETHSEEFDQADPFYAHCKIHSDKALIKNRKRNFNTLRLKMELQKNNGYDQIKFIKLSNEQQKRIERKLNKHRNKYMTNKQTKNEPWVPTQKMPRLLTTSASTCRRLILKAELMGINTSALEFQETQMTSLLDVRKKWHIAPAFSVEFIGYYLDRISRLNDIKISLQDQIVLNKKLVTEQQELRDIYDEKMKLNIEKMEHNNMLTQQIEKLHATIHTLCPTKCLPTIENIGRATITPPPTAIVQQPVVRPMSVPTAAALKMGVGFPLTNLPGTNDDTNRILSTQCQKQNNTELLHECGICKRCIDQHLLAKCDTCHLHYHLGCLNPPLTRHPKKSKQYGWQCSECDKSDESDVAGKIQVVGPRKSRTKYSKDGTIVPVDPPTPTTATSTSLSMENISLGGGDSSTPRNSTNSIGKTMNNSNSNYSILSKKSKKRSSSSSGGSAGSGSGSGHHHYRQPDKIEEVLIPSIIDNNDLLLNKSYKSDEDGSGVGCGHNNISNKRKKTQHQQSLNSKKMKNSYEENTSFTDDPLDVSEIERNVDSSSIDGNFSGFVKNVPTLNGVISTPQISDIFKSDEKLNSNSLVMIGIQDNIALMDTNLSSINNLNNNNNNNNNSNNDNDNDNNSNNSNTNDIASTVTNAVAPPIDCVDTVAAASVADTNAEVTNNHNNEITEINSYKRKRRKEKHRSRHGSESDRASKEHKKKRKKKSYDHENPNTAPLSENVQRIKIKFKALPPLPGETTAEPQFYYVSADMVRPAGDNRRSRPASIDSYEDVIKSQPPPPQPPPPPPPPPPSSSSSSSVVQSKLNSIKSPAHKSTKSSSKLVSQLAPSSSSSSSSSSEIVTSTPIYSSAAATTGATSNPLTKIKPSPIMRTRRLSVYTPFKYQHLQQQPQHLTQQLKKSAATATITTAANTAGATGTSTSSTTNNATAIANRQCFVCNVTGTAQELVQCDECHKNYHFQCLEPPLKKTPKRRGYSWHCAECDPTGILRLTKRII